MLFPLEKAFYIFLEWYEMLVIIVQLIFLAGHMFLGPPFNVPFVLVGKRKRAFKKA